MIYFVLLCVIVWVAVGVATVMRISYEGEIKMMKEMPGYAPKIMGLSEFWFMIVAGAAMGPTVWMVEYLEGKKN